MEDFTPEEVKIITEGLEYTDSIRKKLKERKNLCEERVLKMVKQHEFQMLFPNTKEKEESHEKMFLSIDETQQHLYNVISLELFGGVNYTSKQERKINENHEVKRINNILETIFNTHKAVWCYLGFLHHTGDINKPIKIKFKSKSTKSFLVDLERTLNKFKKNNIKDEIERLEKLLEFFPKVDAEIRGEKNK